MKYLFHISIFVLLAVSAKAQLFTVPEMVKQVFTKQYPNAKDVKWSGGLDNHTVRFTLSGKQLKTSYTPKGDWVVTETPVKMEELPEVVQNGFKNCRYKDLPVIEIISAEKPRAVANEYKIILQKSKITKKILVFDAKGRLYEEFTGL